LNAQLSNEKAKNKKLTNLYNTLSENTIKLEKEIEELKLKMQQRPKISPSNSSNNDIIMLYKKIYNLNEALKRYPVILEKNEKLISIIFESSDQTMHYSMICKNTDTISVLQKRLYKEYPDFIDSDNIFLSKGNAINRNKSFESYKIKNGDIIVVNKRED